MREVRSNDYRYMKKLVILVLLVFIALVAFGCMPPPESAEAGPMDPKEFIFGSVWFFLMALFVYYLLVLNPSRLRAEDQDKFISVLKKGDEVQTTSGILGRVVLVKPEYITLEIASNVKVKVLPKFVQEPSGKEKPDAKKPDAKKADAKKQGAEKPKPKAKK